MSLLSLHATIHVTHFYKTSTCFLMSTIFICKIRTYILDFLGTAIWLKIMSDRKRNQISNLNGAWRWLDSLVSGANLPAINKSASLRLWTFICFFRSNPSFYQPWGTTDRLVSRLPVRVFAAGVTVVYTYRWCVTKILNTNVCLGV